MTSRDDGTSGRTVVASVRSVYQLALHPSREVIVAAPTPRLWMRDRGSTRTSLAIAARPGVDRSRRMSVHIWVGFAGVDGIGLYDHPDATVTDHVFPLPVVNSSGRSN
jgi:hypothetical protein